MVFCVSLKHNMVKTHIVGLEGKNNNSVDNGGEKGQVYSEREHAQWDASGNLFIRRYYCEGPF